MKNNQGIALLIIIIIVAGILALGGGGYYAVKQYKTTAVQPVVTQNPTSTQPTQDKTANWKTYIDPRDNFEFKYPIDWILSESIVNNNVMGVVRKTNLNKLDYIFSIDITDKPYGGEAVSPDDTIPVVDIDNQKVFRHKDPVMQEVGIDWYFDLVVYESTKSYPYNNAKKLDLYSFSLKHNGYYYSISYNLPKGTDKNNYNKQIINEADQILSTFRFTSPASSTIDTSNWKTYTNTQYGFEIKYPTDLKIEESPKTVNSAFAVKIYDANYKVPEGAVGQQIREEQRSVIINILEKSDANLNTIKKDITYGEPGDKTNLWSEKVITVDGKPVKFYALWSGLVGNNYESYFSNDKYIFDATSFQSDFLGKILSTFKFAK